LFGITRSFRPATGCHFSASYANFGKPGEAAKFLLIKRVFCVAHRRCAAPHKLDLETKAKLFLHLK
jgi:hypothetical protein